jgi:cell division protease FtsH
VFLGGGGPGLSSRPYAEATQSAIDAEVARLLREAEERAADLLRTHRAELEQLAGMLTEHETVDGEAVYRLVGTAPPEHGPDTTVVPHRSTAGQGVVPPGGSAPGAPAPGAPAPGGAAGG